MRKCTAPLSGHIYGSVSHRECPIHGTFANQDRAIEGASARADGTTYEATSTDRCLQARIYEAKNEVEPPSDVERHRAIVECRAAAANPNTAPSVLASIVICDDVWVHEHISRNPSTPPELLAVMALSQNATIREGVAMNVSCPPAVLRLFIKDERMRVRQRAASNPNAGADTLTLLASDPAQAVRNAVCGNPNTPCEIAADLRTRLLEGDLHLLAVG